MNRNDANDEEITPELRARADAMVARMRARWAASDEITDRANRAFAVAFAAAMRKPTEDAP